MKICVVGAGAIGGLMGAKFALAGEDVTLIDQGTHLAAIQENGLKLIWEDGTEYVVKNIKAIDAFEDAGPALIADIPGDTLSRAQAINAFAYPGLTPARIVLLAKEKMAQQGEKAQEDKEEVGEVDPSTAGDHATTGCRR